MNDTQHNDIGAADLIRDDILADHDLSCIYHRSSAAPIGELVQAVSSTAKSFAEALRGEWIALCNPGHLLIETGDSVGRPTYRRHLLNAASTSACDAKSPASA